jgi:hypothetical protein
LFFGRGDRKTGLLAIIHWFSSLLLGSNRFYLPCHPFRGIPGVTGRTLTASSSFALLLQKTSDLGLPTKRGVSRTMAFRVCFPLIFRNATDLLTVPHLTGIWCTAQTESCTHIRQYRGTLSQKDPQGRIHVLLCCLRQTLTKFWVVLARWAKQKQLLAPRRDHNNTRKAQQQDKRDVW